MDMEIRHNFIPEPLPSYGLAEDAPRIHHNEIKVRRTYGWLCPFQDYKSNKCYNVQRHIDSIHGKGSREPIDSRTGETRAQKRMNANSHRNMPQSSSDCMGPRFCPISPIPSGKGVEGDNMRNGRPQTFVRVRKSSTSQRHFSSADW